MPRVTPPFNPSAPSLPPPKPVIVHGFSGVFVFQTHAHGVRLSFRRVPEERDAFAAEMKLAQFQGVMAELDAQLLARQLGLFRGGGPHV